MTEWAWILGGPPPSGVELRLLTSAMSRSVTWRVDGPATAQFTLDGRHSEAAELSDLATDLTIYRDGTKVFRGRVTTTTDVVSANRHTVSCSAIDYRGMLAYRMIGESGRIFSAVDQGTIAWTLISESQALSGGNWSITNGVGSTSGTVRDRTYEPGKSIGDAIAELGRVDGGFEWSIDSSLALNRYYPRRGSASGAVLDYGGAVTSVIRSRVQSDYANSVLVTGDMALAPARATSGTISTDPRGRWELARSYSTIKEAATLSGRATWLLNETATARPEIAATLSSGVWQGPGSLFVGDTATLAVNSGRWAASALHRVVELSVQVDSDGKETVELGLVAS